MRTGRQGSARACRAHACGGAVPSRRANDGSCRDGCGLGECRHLAVTMANYEFIPNRLAFRRGIPYRLHVQNQGTEIHDFPRPSFSSCRSPRPRWRSLGARKAPLNRRKARHLKKRRSAAVLRPPTKTTPIGVSSPVAPPSHFHHRTKVERAAVVEQGNRLSAALSLQTAAENVI